MTQDRREWNHWIRVLVDPNAGTRGFTLEGLEFIVKYDDPVTDEMYGTLPGDSNTQPGNFWVVAEREVMRVCPSMQKFAQGKDWFFPVEFCDTLLRPSNIEPVQTRDATVEEKTEALQTFSNTQAQLRAKGDSEL